MNARYSIAIIAMVAALAGCGHRSSATVSATNVAVEAAQPKAPSAILVTESDITDRPYINLGDITVSVSKNTIFDSDPNRALVTEKLQAEAAEMGADAVVLARYGAVGISFFSWGTMEGKGRAVRFTR